MYNLQQTDDLNLALNAHRRLFCSIHRKKGGYCIKMEKNENQRIKLTKRLLKESLLKLLTEKNIKKISVSELCQTAGINRSTFYNHYNQVHQDEDKCHN